MKKVSLILVVILSLSLFLIGCGKSADNNQTLNSLERVKKAGKILAGTDDSFPPMEFRDENNNLVGFDIDMADAIGKKLGIPVEFVPTDFNGIILAMQSGKFDVIIATLSITDKRKESINFSDPYVMEGQIVAVKKGNEAIKNPKDLAGKVVGCQLGSTSEEAASKLSGLKELRKYDKVTEAFHDLSVGRLDAMVVDELVGRYYISKKADEYVVLDEKLNDEPVGIGFKKEDKELQEAIQKAFDELKADGTMSNISIKWFGVDIYKK